jgi:hypothetical protein
VTIEYARLPRTDATTFGTVSFGPLNPNGSVISAWTDVHYRMFTNTSVDYTAPQGMTLNRWNVLTSSDFARDTTPEVVVLSSVTATRVSLRPCHIYADRVFAVQIDGAVLPTSLWTFNRDSQEVTLLAGVPSAGYPVTVTFAPKRPVTSTYLETQPFNQSPVILNEGTPTFQESQAGSATYSTISVSTVSGSGGNTPQFPPAGPTDPNYFLRDPYIVRDFSDEAQYLYERMEFVQVDNAGQAGRLASYCEGGVGSDGTWGTTEFGFGATSSGSALSDSYGGVTFSGREFSPGMPGAGGTALGREQLPGKYRYSLMASGAGINGGGLGTYSYMNPTTTVVTPFSGTAPETTEAEPRMLYPTAPAGSYVTRAMDEGALHRETLFVLRTGAPPGTVTIWTGGSQDQTWG